MIWMLIHCITTCEARTEPFAILRQTEVPYGYPNAGLHRELSVPHDGGRCPECGRLSVTIHEYVPKVVNSGTYNGTPIYDSFLHRRFTCVNCSRTFMERLNWLHPYQQMTESGKNALLYAAADGTFQAVGEDFGRSGQNVKAHVRRNYEETVNANQQAQPTPAFLGIDEISLAKGKAVTVPPVQRVA